MSRDYCFTVYETEVPDLKLSFDKEKIKYIIIGRETCKTTGRKHLQCYACFPRTYAFKGAQKILGCGKSHIRKKYENSSREQARDYCKKEGDWEEWGVFEPLTTKDIFNLPLEKIKSEYKEFYCRYHRGLEKLQEKGPKWRGKVRVTILTGKSGVGKTRRVMEMDSVYKFDPPYKWFDGYENEEILLIDDYEDKMINRGLLLNICDGYRQKLETKGSHVWAYWNEVYITTNSNPEDLLDDPAFKRRIDVIETMSDDGAGVILTQPFGF